MFPSLAPPIICLLALAAFAVPALADDALQVKLAPLIAAHEGKVAVAIKQLKTGEAFRHNADVPMPTASLIKLPIMVEAYRQAEEGKLDLTKLITLRQEDKAPGSGILTQHFSPGMSLPLVDAIHLMIVYSDNTATNLVLDNIGLPAMNGAMEKLGFTNTKINAKVFKGSTTSIAPERTKKFGLGSTTAREMIRLLEFIESGKVVSAEACQEMIAHLKACDDKEKMTRLLPAGTVVAHKTGSVNACKTDAGIIYLKSGPVAICVLTDENKDERWVADNAGQVLIAKVAKEVFDHFATGTK